MTRTIRWGILGTGSIARQFARGLAVLPDAALVAVGSRAQSTADAFGDEFKAPRRHGSYEALAADAEVDVIYVATPHPLHKPNTILCLEHGKAVLCEKPFAVNAAEAREMIDAARAAKRFVMEAMWTRFLPVIVQVRTWLRQGRIGEVRMVTADFGFRADYNEETRVLNPELAGGALLDVGVYPISFASMVYGGPPKAIATRACLGKTGVDEQNAMVLEYPGGALALLSSAVRTNTPQEVRILGTTGMIHVPPPFWRSERAVLSVAGKDDEVCSVPHVGNGYEYEAEEVMHCLRLGRLESEGMPHDETLSVMETMDAVRAQWHMKYPME